MVAHTATRNGTGLQTNVMLMRVKVINKISSQYTHTCKACNLPVYIVQLDQHHEHSIEFLKETTEPPTQCRRRHFGEEAGHQSPKIAPSFAFPEHPGHYKWVEAGRGTKRLVPSCGARSGYGYTCCGRQVNGFLASLAWAIARVRRRLRHAPRGSSCIEHRKHLIMLRSKVSTPKYVQPYA